MDKNNRRGFTLLEVLVSTTIIAVLTIIGVVSYGSVNKRSRDVKRKSDIEQIRSALEMFRSDTGGYPAVNTGAFGNVSALNTGNSNTGLVSTYMPSIPTDPKPAQNYYFRATNLDATTGKYYGYCICGNLETLGASSSCTIALPGSCNYGLKSP